MISGGEVTLPWRRAWAVRGDNRGLMLGVWMNATLLIASVGALAWDHRQILGLNPWIKPMKFEISLIIYLLTLALLVSILGEGGRWRRRRSRITWGIGVAAAIEITLIALQSVRGVPSHMNYTSALNGLLFGIMGLFILLNTVLLAELLWLFCVTPLGRPPAELWGIRFGLLMILAGSLEGVLLVIHGSHTVGARDGGAGLPFLNWSTLHGDLRVAHFFALHALQLLWAVGWAMGRMPLSPRLAVTATLTTGFLYAAGVWLLFSQAMAGHPLFSPG